MIKEIKFTDKAIKQINNLLSQKDPGSFFRIAIKGGGCSGLQYEFTFDKKLEADDLKHFLLHGQMVYDLSHELNLKFQLDHRLNRGV